MEEEAIEIFGARVHNLKNINLKIPKNKLVVICGVSGSGKSSLAFDTIYAEGQRRYLESLSSYARQFLGGFKKPDVEKIVNLSPTLAINQKTISQNPRSTVGTITEIYDYLRLLFAHLGKPFCPQCQKPISSQTSYQIVEKIFQSPPNTNILILGPVITAKKGTHQAILEEIQKGGWPQIRIDGRIFSIEEGKEINLEKQKRHNIEVVVGKIQIPSFKIIQEKNLSQKEKEAQKNKKKKIARILKEKKQEAQEIIKKALQIGKGNLIAVFYQKKKKVSEKIFSELFACPSCGISLPKIEPRLFSFNSPYGACPLCQGLGKKLEVEPSLILNPNLSLNEGAIIIWDSLSRFSRRALGVYWQKWVLEEMAEKFNFSLDTPLKNLPKDILKKILYGDTQQEIILKDESGWQGKTHFEGIIPRLERLYHETDSDYVREEISKYMREKICPECNGARLKKEALAVKIEKQNIAQICQLSTLQAIDFFEKLSQKLTQREQKIAQPLLKEILLRYRFLEDVGLDYITLERSANTLSVGESQRIHLATQLGSGLSGVVYVLDEPTIGLHQRDIKRLTKTLKHLRDLKNTVIVVEHDVSVIKEADWIIEIGPGAGKYGGKIVFEGPFQKLKMAQTLTGKYLSKKLEVKTGLSKSPIHKDTKWLEIKGASQFNLKNIDVKIPLSKFVCLAGVSGSGKSTLALEILAKALQRILHRQKTFPGKYKEIIGVEFLDKVIVVDQSPIGRTPRSNPATYTSVFSGIRKVFSQTYEARIRGYSPSHFSFNTKQGRCEACKGEGFKKVEMYFLPDIYVECELCQGKRFSPEVLDVTFKEKNIAQILEMSVLEAEKFFRVYHPIKNKLEVIKEIGLDYIQLGQPATTLSGGEAQRIKLANELSRPATGKTLYILDEPTVGLHFEDIKKLLLVLRKLQQKGNTVLVIEHHPDVIKEADWIIELGPEGGQNGGRIVFEGTLSDLKKASTWTAKFL